GEPQRGDNPPGARRPMARTGQPGRSARPGRRTKLTLVEGRRAAQAPGREMKSYALARKLGWRGNDELREAQPARGRGQPFRYLGRHRAAARSAEWGRGRVRPARRSAPARAEDALLPDARLVRRRRRRAAGDPASGLAEPCPVRRAKLASLLAVPDRDQRLPARDRATAQEGAADGLRSCSRSARRTRGPGERPRLA